MGDWLICGHVALEKCNVSPLGKFLNFKIAYFVLFLSQNTIVVYLYEQTSIRGQSR